MAARMEDRWIVLKQAEGDRQVIYVRLDAIASLAPSGMGSVLSVYGTPLVVEETPQQVIQKMKTAKSLLGKPEGK
jgi:hypothetical protein